MCPKPSADLSVPVSEDDGVAGGGGRRQGFEAVLKLQSQWDSGKNRQRAGRTALGR